MLCPGLRAPPKMAARGSEHHEHVDDDAVGMARGVIDVFMVL